ncbi:CpaF family protein [Bdellovibrionota bacterium]
MVETVFSTTIRNFLEPILGYLEDPSVTEIMINGPDEVYIEREGKLEKTDAQFTDEGALQAAVRNIAQFVGKKVDEEHSRLDARLPDGSRIHAVIPPCARGGTTVAIRKFSAKPLSLRDLIKFGALSVDSAKFLDVCIYLRKNMIISGGTGSGKTTVLGSLASRVPGNQRIIVIEDASEIQIDKGHVVFFETRPPNNLGQGEVTIRDLVISAMRLRPDRIIVGEVRGPEALDLITAMNTGHNGSMGTTHANTPQETLNRLETLSLMTGIELPIRALRSQIASAVNIIVQTSRMNDGSRKITHISEVTGFDEHGTIQTQDIFRFMITGRTPEGKILGELRTTGAVPTFMGEIIANQLPFSEETFKAA